jgi:hypothetical protein
MPEFDSVCKHLGGLGQGPAIETGHKDDIARKLRPE